MLMPGIKKKVFLQIYIWTIEMKKIVIRSSSNIEKAWEQDIPSSWYTVVHDKEMSRVLARSNPWNLDRSEYESESYLMDDCVITIRPARYRLKNEDTGDHEKDRYFIEISTQDGSVILSSHCVYDWDDVNRLAAFFKGISFAAATRVWKSKRI